MIKTMNVVMRPFSDEEILDFIDKFGDSREAMKGEMCYWFARILAERFGGEVIYQSVDCHFCTLIENRFYDASGNITKEINPNYAMPWKDYQRFEPAHSARVIREAIWKISNAPISDANVD